MISDMTKEMNEYNSALSKISGMLPVRRSTDSVIIRDWGELVHALLEVGVGSVVTFTPVITEPRSGRLLVRGNLESINYSPKK